MQTILFFAPELDIELSSRQASRIAMEAIPGVLDGSNRVGGSPLSIPASVCKTRLLTWQWAMTMMQSSG